eukprot:c11743_g1_i3.p1 GENE.c11743_g1_i3~~c11743_g1_i3.p1  ORF type:complete len:171 (+),score=33.37 c11743_g1_i3:35-514(+)
MELEEGDMATLMAEISLESPIQNGNHRASPFETNFNSSLRDNDATPTIEIPSSPSIGPATQRVGGFVNVSEMRKHLLTTPSGLSDDTNNSEESADPVFARPSPLSTPSPIHMVSDRMNPQIVKPQLAGIFPDCRGRLRCPSSVQPNICQTFNCSAPQTN